MNKPLGQRAYGSIPHLPGSRMGPADHHCHEGQARICLLKPRKGDVIIVQEKLDGSCVSAAKINGAIVPLTRAGYHARTSPYEQHHLWADWVEANAARFTDMLGEGERVVGEWLAQAHGTRYDLPHEPFVAFDFMRSHTRYHYDAFSCHMANFDLPVPRLLGYGPLCMQNLLVLLETSGHGALDPVEGAVYRVEHAGVVDFLAKYVRPDKADGRYLPEVSGAPAVWNWRPESEAR